MPKYVIEREIPHAGKLSADQLHAISQTSCNVLQKLGPSIQWVESFVTDDKIYCIYIAPNEELIRQHAKEGGIPGEQDFTSSDDNQPDHGGLVRASSRQQNSGCAARMPFPRAVLRKRC